MRINRIHKQHRYRRFRPPSRPGQKRRTVLGVLLLAVFGLAAFSELSLTGISPALTQEAARGYVLDCIAQAVEAELEEDAEPFITIERDGDGQIAMVQADPERLNRLRAGVLERLAESLRGRARVHVPAGSLTGIGLLNGRGFPVPISLGIEGSAVAEFSTELISAGVNQTCHRLVLTVRAQAFSQSRRFETAVEAESSTVLAETLVVGEVPRLMVGGGS